MKKPTKKTKCGHKPYRGNLSGFLLGRWCPECKKRIPLRYWPNKALGFPLVIAGIILSVTGCYAEKPAWRRHWSDVRIFSEVSTNWTKVGTFTPTCNQGGCLVIHPSYSVEIGTTETNWYAEIEWRWVKHRFLMEKERGIQIGERRVVEEPFTNYITITNLPFGTLVYTNPFFWSNMGWGRELHVTNDPTIRPR